ncbi:MAG TPA: hypothetical protein VEK15_15110 [Vicinamibacteria bacterium]|nr:hypothetical protein [Vicinamibacteria bacterium]
MKNTTRLMRILGSAALFVGFSAPGWAVQHHHGGHHLHHHGQLPAYDATTELTLEGTVDELVRMERPGCAGCEGGTHVFLGGHDVEIHLGPSSFLESKGCQIKEGDDLRVTGSKLSIDSSSVLLARELHCGGETVVLRDESGRPLWSGGR